MCWKWCGNYERLEWNKKICCAKNTDGSSLKQQSHEKHHISSLNVWSKPQDTYSALKAFDSNDFVFTYKYVAKIFQRLFLIAFFFTLSNCNRFFGFEVDGVMGFKTSIITSSVSKM